MNRYSPTVQRWTDAKLQRECERLAVVAKYSGPAQDRFWLYAAVLEEMKSRKLLTSDKVSR